MTVPDPGVYISPAQMYQEVRGLSETVGRIESKLDGILDDAKDLRKDFADHENRIRTLERGRWPLPALAGVTGMGSLGVALYALISR
ncbi:hypothetical protein [Streptomyces sp. NPDC059979]|uniref:hypothetical protein n=1 Tax=Streptomyces sp. NPDC059979 TaxID=3347021 RepID=UPI0036968556